MIVAIAAAGKCCCDATPCADCIVGDVIDGSAGCCRSAAEKLVYRIERPHWSFTAHGYGSNPFGNPPECTGGCEFSAVYDFPAMDAIQVVYDHEAMYFRCDFGAIDNDRPERCDPNCDPTNTDCCGPPSFPPFDGCVCDPLANLSPHQKPIMESTAQYRWLLDSICHGGGACFPATLGAECAEIPGETTLFGQLLTVVHVEHWWVRSDCEGAVSPVPHVPNDPETPADVDCVFPRRWVFACSGAPLYWFDLFDAVEREIIDSLAMCELVAAIFDGVTPAQATLQALYDGGYLKVKDWRAEILAELTELKDRFPTDYAGCTLPADCGAIGIVGPVRKRFHPCLLGSEVADHTAALQPAITGCGVDPWSGGPYPELGDGDYDDYVFWRDRQYVYFHARPGGWDWICWDPGEPDANAPDLPRRYSVDCPSNSCLDVSGNPRDWTCTDGTFVGTNPGSGLPTCEVGCGDPFAEFGNEWGCITADLVCADDPPSGSKCANTAIAASCDGLHLIYSLVRVVETADAECFPSGYKFECAYANHCYLFGVNQTCGDWSTGDCNACRTLSVPLAVRDSLPNVDTGYRGHVELCTQIDNGCGTAADLCCGSYCLDFEACASVTHVADECVAAPTLSNYAEQEGCLP